MSQTVKVEFNVAMDAEQKKAGNVKKVQFECSFDGVPASLVQRFAIQSQIVTWQSQIRTHWDEFISGDLPKVVTFGNALFASKARTIVKEVTQEDVKAHVAAMSPREKMEFAIEAMKTAGMDTELMEEELAAMIAGEEESEE